MFKNLKIGAKLIVSFGIVLIVAVAIIFVSVISISGVAKDMKTFYDTSHTASIVAWEARRDIRYLEASIYQSMTTTDINITTKCVEQANTSAEGFNANLEKLKTVLPTQLDKINKAIDIAHAAKPYRELVLKYAGENNNDQALKVMAEQYSPELDKIIAIMVEVGDAAEKESVEFAANAAKNANMTMLVMIILGLISVAIIIVLVLIITKSIATPAKLISKRLEQLAEGDINSPMPVIDSEDEIGILAKSTGQLVGGMQYMIGDIVRILTEMADGNLTVKQADAQYKGDFLPLQTATDKIIKNLNSTLSQINEASSQVSSGSDQVSNAAQALAQGATEQASSVQELSASITEISEHVKRNATNAVKARDMSNNASVAIENSNQKMQELMSAMNDINDKSSQINKIIKTIEDIAFQTNILALNAAVEAARAGSAGKGFAVVADEVRNLASKSADAAKDTTNLIESSVNSIDIGVKLASETANELISVVEGAKATTAIISDISDATTEQSASLSQVSLGIEQISAVVQTNSATSEESAAASEELSSQANLMKSLVSKFKLEKDEFRVSYSEPTSNSRYYGSSSSSDNIDDKYF